VTLGHWQLVQATQSQQRTILELSPIRCALPFAGVILDSMGNLYGEICTTQQAMRGTAFEVTP
jgi:hypothetical protein